MINASYIRVSTSEQATKGHSIDTQKENIEKYCEYYGIELHEIYIDAGVTSGKRLGQREQGKKLLEKIESGQVENLIVAKLDRLFRNTLETLKFIELIESKKVTLHVLDLGGQTVDTKSATGRLFLTMVAGMAEMERGLIRERTTAVIGNLRKNRKVFNHPPYGFDVEGKNLKENFEEQKVIQYIYHAKYKFYLSATEIAKRLNAQNIKSKRGGRWSAKTIIDILNRKELGTDAGESLAKYQNQIASR